jgi:hypothetical protein
MPLLDHWFSRTPRPPAPPEPAAGEARPAAGPTDPDVPPKGSAWFESSHELMRGLLVVEEPPGWRLVPRRTGATRA